MYEKFLFVCFFLGEKDRVFLFAYVMSNGLFWKRSLHLKKVKKVSAKYGLGLTYSLGTISLGTISLGTIPLGTIYFPHIKKVKLT